ncbi:GNAT family N-acetyltransferase [Polaribacter sp. ALD11]|uniref:GNAT family N-acetyltransferase n=1 Tax=Polaribacter sp. ALD11 TaxID=2058137 RepID=UPI000C30AEC2|nr:GNAT family N-acetyltransferase [Polaribacter sp. ALD11]AUC86083.1 GNAT family N-acetyltransferase [Polaribacter sp. ALD11]
MLVEATISDAKILTQIVLESKAYWGYSEDQIEGWREDLMVTSKMFEDWHVYKYLIDTKIVGFCILNTTNARRSIIEFLFVSPKVIKQRIGKQLLDHVIEHCIGCSSVVLNVLSDPNAKRFYAKHGFKVIAETESSIPGRLLPEMELEFPENM